MDKAKMKKQQAWFCNTDEGSNIDLDVAFALPAALKSYQNRHGFSKGGAKEEEIC